MNSSVLNFLKLNIKWLIPGILLVVLGYVIMAWDIQGVNPDENVYAWHKLTLAPIILLLGYIVIGMSIMIKPKK